MHIVIIGAGIIGVTTAYCLARAGHTVQVLEREPGPGRVCSFANGGQFSYSYTEPLASPTLFRQLPLMLLRRDSPLSVKAAALPGLVGWSRHFLRHCNTRRMQDSTAKVLYLALHSRRVLHEIQDREGFLFDYRCNGKLHLYFDESALAAVEPLMAIKNRLGCKQQVLNCQDCVELEPALRDSVHKTIVGGIYSPLDECGDSYTLTNALAETCTNGADVGFIFGCVVRSLRHSNSGITGVATNRGVFEADAFVICAGTGSAHLCHDLGVRLPIQPAKGYSLTLPAVNAALKVSITDARAKMVYSLLGDRLRIAGLLDFAGHDCHEDRARFERLLVAVRTLFPKARDYAGVAKHWCGLRPLTPDGAPLIGAIDYANLYLNTGHGMLGSTLACGSASLITDIIGGRPPMVDPVGFSPGRFTD